MEGNSGFGQPSEFPEVQMDWGERMPALCFGAVGTGTGYGLYNLGTGW